MQMVRADSSFSIATADPEVWRGVGMRCISSEARHGDALKMADFKLKQFKKSVRRSHPDHLM